MFGYFRKGRSESKTFINDKVEWSHFMEGFKDLVYEHALSNIFKKYPDYRIEFDEYIKSLKYFNELYEYYSTHLNKVLDKTNITWIERVYTVIGTNSFAKSTNEYKKGKLFEILLILYITEGHKMINNFSDFIEKWFRDGILILITDQGDEVINEMKNQFFDKKSEFSYIYKTKFNRFIFEIERETGKINLLIFPSYCEYFSRFNSLQYSYDSKPIAKCLWTSKTKDGFEATFVPTPLSKEEHKRAHSKDNKDWSIVGTRLFDQGIKIKLNLDELCKYEEERNTKRLIRKVTGMSNKRYKEFLNDVKRRVYRSDLQSEMLIAKLSKATDLPIDNYTVSIAMSWLNIGRGWNVSHIKVTDLLDAIIEMKEEDN
nr:MAG TPA: hypothetical protein [Caudoviricetes sp.]